MSVQRNYYIYVNPTCKNCAINMYKLLFVSIFFFFFFFFFFFLINTSSESELPVVSTCFTHDL